MAGLYLGAAALSVPGLASVRKGAEQLWPAAPPGPSSPEVIWSVTSLGSGGCDWSAETDIEVGDVIFVFGAGTFGANNVASTGYQGPVAQNGFFSIHNNGNSSRSYNLSGRIVTASNIGDANCSSESGGSQIAFCVRGLDLTQFATSTVNGRQVVDDQTMFTTATTTGNIDSGSVTVDNNDSIVFTMGAVFAENLTLTPPSGYTLINSRTGTAASTPRTMGLAQKAGVNAGSEDPAAWSGAGGGEGSTRSYTLVLAPS